MEDPLEKKLRDPSDFAPKLIKYCYLGRVQTGLEELGTCEKRRGPTGHLHIHPLCLCSFIHRDMHVHLQHINLPWRWYSTTTKLDVGCLR